MTSVGRTVIAGIVLTVLAAGAGGWVGVQYGLSHTRSSASLNRLLHHELDLDADQQRRLAAMESAYAAQRKALESHARAANRELADALLTEHQYGPQAERAIDHFSAAMKALQVATVVHVMAMRAVLTPGQAKKFDRTLVTALDTGGP